MDTISPDTVAKFNELISWVMDSVKEGGTFIATQVPLVVQQLIAYEFYYQLTCIICGFILVLIGFTLLPLLIRKVKEDFNCWGPLLMIPAFLFIIGGITVGGHTAEFIKVTVAPKVFVLEKCRSILKGY